MHKITAESAENGYFKGDPTGRSESEVEKDLNNLYELPFNILLPSLTSGLVDHLDSALVQVCAKYMANLLLRSKPRREATKAHSRRFDAEFNRRLQDELTLKRFAASVSLRLGRSVLLSEVREAAQQFLLNESASETIFFQSATTDFSQLPTTLSGVHWSVCHSPHLKLLQSDAAVALLNKSLDTAHVTTYGDGILKLGSQWYLPISPRFALRASAHYLPSAVLSLREADQVNEYMIRAAYGVVYSSILDSTIDRFVKLHIYSLRYFEQLIVVDARREVEGMLFDLLN